MTPFDWLFNIFGVLAHMIKYPFIALIVAGFFAGLGLVLKDKLLKITALLWALYGIYEYVFYFTNDCIGACIRIDLFLIYTALIFSSLVALGRIIFQKLKQAKNI